MVVPYIPPFLTWDGLHPVELWMTLVLHSYVKDTDNLCIYCEMLFVYLDELFWKAEYLRFLSPEYIKKGTFHQDISSEALICFDAFFPLQLEFKT